MSYAETLERLGKIQDDADTGLTEPTKAPSVSFVSPRSGQPEKVAAMPTRPEIDQICRRACFGLNVYPARLAGFLEVAEDPAWCTERIARHLARRMAEGMIR